jgi:hypothetical protein
MGACNNASITKKARMRRPICTLRLDCHNPRKVSHTHCISFSFIYILTPQASLAVGQSRQKAGMRYAILTAKHHDGLWLTQITEQQPMERWQR